MYVLYVLYVCVYFFNYLYNFQAAKQCVACLNHFFLTIGLMLWLLFPLFFLFKLKILINNKYIKRSYYDYYSTKHNGCIVCILLLCETNGIN